jgi:CDP-paratose 2-epimerase
MRYIGFDGAGHQVRDALHPREIRNSELQIRSTRKEGSRIHRRRRHCNSTSLANLNTCVTLVRALRSRARSQPRPYDVPWLISLAAEAATISDGNRRDAWFILDEISGHAEHIRIG